MTNPIRNAALCGTVLLAAGLGGCVSHGACTGDPRTDSLSCGMANLSAGRYRADTERMERAADASTSRAAAARLETARLSSERASLGRASAALDAGVGRTEAEMRAARSDLGLSQDAAGARQAEIARLDQRLAEARQRRALAQAPADIAALEEEIARLGRALEVASR